MESSNLEGKGHRGGRSYSFQLDCRKQSSLATRVKCWGKESYTTTMDPWAKVDQFWIGQNKNVFWLVLNDQLIMIILMNAYGKGQLKMNLHLIVDIKFNILLYFDFLFLHFVYFTDICTYILLFQWPRLIHSRQLKKERAPLSRASPRDMKHFVVRVFFFSCP